jgi:transcriptional regulatory protein AMDR
MSSNLEDCDVPSLTPSDFEGCNDQTQINFVIKFTELYVLISSILRARFSARKNLERRRQVLRRADETLADWISQLPEHFHLSYSNLDLWPALLHMTYNNFLIILHRPQPFATSDIPDYGPNDGDICGEAATTIVAIAEQLRETDQLKYSWISSVNSLFTAMIQVNAELRFSNPVLAITGQRRFDSALLSLRYLSGYWLSACTVLRLFDEKSEAIQQNPPAAVNNNKNGRQRPGRADRSLVAEDDENSNNNNNNMEEDDLDWRQLFSFLDTDRESFHARPVEEDEWREMYWQDISLTDLGDEFFLNV